MKKSYRFFFLFIAFLCISCASVERKKEKEITYPPVKQNKPDFSALEKPLLKADLSLLSEKAKRGRYDLVFRDAPLREVIMTIARDRGLNVVFDSTVDPNVRVSMDVRGVTFEQALKLITEPYGVYYIVDGNILWVFKDKIITEIFKLKTLNIKRAVAVTSSIQSGGTSAGEGAGGVFSTTTTTTNEFNIWEDVGCNLCAILGLECRLGGTGGGRGGAAGSVIVRICSEGKKFVAINRTTGHVIVSASVGDLKKIKEYMDITQASLNKQVILDVKIIEVVLSNKFQYGVDWTKVFDNVFRSKGNYSVRFVQSSTAGGELLPIPGFSAFSIYPTGTVQNPFNLIINALKVYGDVHVISSPRLAVANNQAAVIKVGEDMKFVTDVSSESAVTEGATTVGCDVDTETYFVGVSLTLTPYIDETGEVTLFIHPNVTELKDVRRFTSECGNVPIEEPVFDVRELDTIVKVRDNETLVIGGLIKNTSSNKVYVTPGLSKIPIVGELFKRKEREKEKAELVIFITPHVIYNTTPLKAFRWNNNVEIIGE